MTMRERVRDWLWGEEIRAIRATAAQVERTAEGIAQMLLRQAALVEGVSRLRVQVEILLERAQEIGYQAKLGKDLQAEALSELRSVRARALEELGKLDAAQERLCLLLEPVAERRRRAAVTVPDWDQVQARNLEEFVEPK
ncbi:MAG: hypothetical protein ACLGQX_02735 [Acidobacteriota bacterium]